MADGQPEFLSRSLSEEENRFLREENVRLRKLLASHGMVQRADCEVKRLVFAGVRADVRGKETMKDDWVPLEFPPPEIEEQLAKWFASRQGDVGFCLLCGSTIPPEDDIIPDTNTHNCPEGRVLEARILREQRPRCSGTSQPKTK